MSWLHRLSIAQKIQVLVTLSVVGIASVGGLALWSNVKLSSAARNVGSVQLPAVRNMTLSDMMHDGLRALVYQALLAAQDPSADTDSAAVLADVQDFGANFRGFLAAIDGLDVHPDTRAAIEEVRPSIEAYIGSCETIARHGAEGNLAAARAELPHMEELFGVLEEALGALGERIEGDADRAVEESDAVARRARTSLLVALGVLGLGAWALGRFVARQITEPLEAAIEVLESGDVSLLAAVDTDDEIGRMARAVEQTVQTLEESKVELEAQKDHLAASASAMERSAKEAEEQARMAAELKLRAEEQAVLAEEQAQHAAEQAKNAAEQAQRAEEIAAEAARVAAMVENSPKPMMFADEALVVRYANPAAKTGLAAFGRALSQRTLEGCDLSVFYRHPDGNERFFRNARNLPYATRFAIGDQTVALSCSAIAGPSGERMGTLLAWENVTEQLAAERAAREASERETRQAHELQERVDRMLEVVDAAARGDLTVMIAVDGEDSIGHMAEALNRFLGDLRSSLGRIRTGAESLAKSAESLHGVSQAMSTEAAQTSSQVQVASGAADEVSSSVRTVAEGNHGMEQSIREIAQSASAAARVARQAVETATSTNATVTELDQASRQIGAILKTITTIAEQTNLLALNATIEAARAGEMGKGFAVVANEVKELAQETAKATKDITGMIGAMQAGSRGAVEAISRISTIIGEIDELQSTIVAAVEEQTSATSEMSRHLTVATRSATQITQNMAGVAQAAHSTSDGAANTLDVAVSVSDMAEELLGAVGQFRV